MAIHYLRIRRELNSYQRDEAETIVKAQWWSFPETGGDIMVSGGNSYSLPYTDDIINAPDTQSDFYIIDAGSFYQMIIHGLYQLYREHR